MSDNSFYITTPIYYPNGRPHMGHAYTSIQADVIARYRRLLGSDTYFLTGTDENSEKVVEAARRADEDPEPYTDKVVQQFKAFFTALSISYNQFIRTSDEQKHWPGVVRMWERIEKAGDIYKDIYEGLYCVGCEEYKTEKDLDESGCCPAHGTKPKTIKEENYFFKLSKYSDAIKEKIENDVLLIQPSSRRNEILALLEEGLQDVSFSRPKKEVPWGIPVPGDESQVVYVWCDALTNYISALGFGREEDSNFTKFWPADVHLIGKDILRFHTAIWPAMLLSAGISLPKQIFVHGFILSGGKKMSKTRGNVLDPEDFIDTYGAEALRYFLTREMSILEDSDMTEERFAEAYNANLANGLGNVVSRILKMAEQYDVDFSDLTLADKEEVFAREDTAEYHAAMKALEVNRAADFVWSLIAFMDSYIQDEKPFKTIKSDPDKAHRDILFLVERLWEVAVLLEPFLPETAERIQSAIEHNKVPDALFPRHA